MWFLILAACVALSVLLFSYYAYRTAFFSPVKKRKTSNRFFSSAPALAAVKKEFLARVDAAEKADFREITVVSHDGLTLFGRYYERKKGAPVEIAFHGYRSTAIHDGCVAYESAVRYETNLLLVDQRAHGKSGGKTITFGVLERFDVLTWAEEVVRRFGAETEILLSGVSMGAASVLMASSLPLPANVRGILADCPYSSPKGIIEKVVSDHHLPGWVVYPFVRLGARLFGRFDPSLASAIGAVGEAKVPILLAHGEEDTFVPCGMSREIAAVKASVRFFTYSGADHGLSYFSDPVRYRKMCDDFRREVLSPFEGEDVKVKKEENLP